MIATKKKKTPENYEVLDIEKVKIKRFGRVIRAVKTQ